MTKQIRKLNDKEAPILTFFGLCHSVFLRHLTFGFRHSAKAALLSAIALLLLTSGCHTYQYRVVQPPQAHSIITGQPVMIHYDPLEYTFARVQDRLAISISNPTTNQVVLRGDKSFVMSPRGESHPIPGRVIGARSYARMLLPPQPATAEVIGYYGYPWAWGPGFYGYGAPFSRGFYDPFAYGPAVTYFQLNTPYDWLWRTGPIQLHLGFERNGQPFEHHFEILRERAP
jgi:hypothetical protein